MANHKAIIIQKSTDDLLKKLKVGDESYNSIIWRYLSRETKLSGAENVTGRKKI